MDGEGKEERTHLRRGRGGRWRGGGGGGGRAKEIKYEGGGSGGGVLPCFRVDVGGGKLQIPRRAHCVDCAAGDSATTVNLV